MSERVMIIDANALIHRSYHALPALTATNGEPAGALYGLCLTLLNVLKTFKPTHIAAAFDRPEKTFRHKEYEDYKGGRKEADADLIKQIIRARDVFAAFGIPTLEIAGYEADDIVGTVSQLAKKQKTEAIIVTGDQDTLQLVGPDVRVYMLKRGIKDTVTMGPKEVIDRYRLKPEQMIDYKALRGDPSDNIPGVPGIGEKSAVQLLQKYKTVEHVYEHLDELPEGLQKKLKEGEQKAQMSYRLASIQLDVPLNIKFEDLAWNNYQREKVLVLLRELGFSSLLSKIPGTDVGFQQATVKRKQGSLLPEVQDMRAKRRTPEYECVTTEKRAREVAKILEKKKTFVIDTETDSLEARNAHLCGFSISVEEGKAWYIPSQFLPVFKELLENEGIEKMGHNLKYDAEALSNAEIKLKPLNFDSMLASYSLTPNSRSHGLDNLTFTVLGHEMIPIEALIGKRGPSQKNMSEVPVDDVAEYSCEDADYTLRLINHFKKELKQKPGPQSIFYDIEMPLLPVLINMELTGVKLDSIFLKKLSVKIGRRLKVLEKEIHDLAGGVFNINSPVQLQEILFKKLKLSTVGIGRIQSGLSTAAEELDKLRDQHKIIPKIQEYRELSKLKNTYIDALPKLVDEKTKRIHTSYNQTITATGRLSSSDPNLQNIPVRTELGNEIRTAFVAEKGKLLVGADYSQLELRIAAHVAKDKVMQQAFREGKDIHTETAAIANKVPLEEVTKEQRRQAKALNFGVLYGMGPQAFARAANVTFGEAQAFIDEYMRTYRGIAEYMEEAKALAATQGYVETIYGRHSYLPEINSGNPQVRSAAERAAINHPIQGAESDIIKRAMVAVFQKIVSKEGAFKNAQMILQVHDELVFEVPEKEAKSFAEELKSFLEGLEKLSVPLTVELKMGKNWGEMKTLK